MRDGLVRELLYRRVPHITGIYLAGGWGLLEFSDWAMVRWDLSAVVVDGVMGGWLAALPLVLMLSWRFGAPGPQHGPFRQSPSHAKSVAVLPFESLGDDPEDAALAMGLSDEIVSVLTRVPGLRVASRTSAVAHARQGLDVGAIGRALGVEAVLEGSVQHSGSRLRVITRLVSVSDGYHLWADKFDGPMDEIFRIEDEIAGNVARAFRVILAEPGPRRSARVAASDPRAYAFCLRGRQFLYRIRRKSLGFARDMFQRAMDADPGYAPAHAGLAEAIATLDIFYPSSGADLDRADQASRRALELGPDLAEAHSARGTVLAQLGRRAEAAAEFEAAIAMDPDIYQAHYYYARVRFQEGDFDRAADLFEAAHRIREDPDGAFFAAQAYEAAGRTEAAQAAYDRAWRVAERHMEMNPDDARTATMRAVALCRTGRPRQGLQWAERALDIDPHDAGVRYNVACLYAVEGRPKRALACLEEAVGRGFGKRDWVERDPDLDALRDDPRFHRLLDELDRRSGPPAASPP